MRDRVKSLAMGAVVICLVAAAYGEIVTWPAAPGTAATNGAFTVKVNGRDVDVIEIPKPTHCLVGDDAQPYYAAFFDADEEVTVEVTGAANMRRTRILPTRRGIAPQVKGDHTTTFRAKPPFTVAVEPSGRHKALVIAANVPEKDVPRPDDPNVVYFGPGRHRRDKAIKLSSGQTLYLAPGAYVEGWVVGKGDNMTIRGRGILSGLPWQWGKGPVGWMCGLQGKHITVKDVTLMSSWTWMLVFNEAEDVLVDNIKLLNGRTLNDDGIDICRSRRVTIRNSFVRAQDDCIAPKHWCEDLTVENCALWTDVANIIRVGYESLGREYPFRNHVYRHIDVLHQAIHNTSPSTRRRRRISSSPFARRSAATARSPTRRAATRATSRSATYTSPRAGPSARTASGFIRLTPRRPGGVPRARGHSWRGEEHQGPALPEV